MLHLKNFRPYTPEDPWLGQVIYLQDEAGNDWYLVQKHFRKDTFKVFYDANEEGQICAITQDISGNSPEGLCVVEMEPEDIPKGVSINPEDRWVYQDGIVSRPLVQYEMDARKLRDSFLKATDPMMVIDFTINDEMLTDDQRVEVAKVRVAFKAWPKTEGWPWVPLPDVPQWILDQAILKGFSNKKWPE